MVGTMTNYDVIVIGGGPAGYTAAGRTAAAGLKTLLIEGHKLGGLCLNAGCIPTKTLLHTAKLYAQMRDSAQFGIELDEMPRMNWATLLERKQQVVEKLYNGIRFQMLRRRVEILEGFATLIDRKTVQVNDDTYTANHIVIATGASPNLPIFAGSENLLTTTDLLSLPTLPESLVLVGASEIGFGLATVFSLMGVQVTLVDEPTTILPDFEPELVETLIKELPSITLQLGKWMHSLQENILTLADGTQIQADYVAFAGERLPNIAGLGLEAVGLDLSGGCINVDEKMQTNVPNIYAVGDVTGISMWAHTAQRMGEVVASTITGVHDRFRLRYVPTVVYSEPQLAMVGLTEAKAKEIGYSVQVGRLSLNYNGRYLTEHNIESQGLCKVVIDEETNLILGMHLLGGNASELIFGAATMLADEFRVQDVQQMLFAHPTVAEVLKDTLYEL